MDKIEVIKKHILSLPELRAKKEPGKMKSKAKYEESFEIWEREEKVKSGLRQLKHTHDNSLIGGSAQRAIRYDNIDNLLEEDLFVLGDGEDHPDFERVFNTLAEPNQIVRLNVEGLRCMSEVVAKAVTTSKVTIKEDELIFEPKTSCANVEGGFNESRLKLDTSEFYPTIEFLVNPTYLVGMLKLAKRLKIKEIDLQFVSSIRPLLFVGVDDSNFNYIVTPIR